MVKQSNHSRVYRAITNSNRPSPEPENVILAVSKAQTTHRYGDCLAVSALAQEPAEPSGPAGFAPSPRRVLTRLMAVAVQMAADGLTTYARDAGRS